MTLDTILKAAVMKCTSPTVMNTTLQILGPSTSYLSFAAQLLTMVLPKPHAKFTAVSFRDLVGILVDTAAADLAHLQAAAGPSISSTASGGIDLVSISAGAAAAGNAQYDGLFIDPVAIVDLTIANSMMDLTSLVQGIIDWTGIHPFYRDAVVIDSGRVNSLPLGGNMHQMFYRQDVLALHNLSVPATWDQFLSVVKKVNGTVMGSGPNETEIHGLCWQQTANCANGHNLAAIWSSYIQTSGPSQGAFFDPLTMLPLINNPAMIRAMEIYQQLQPYTPSDDNLPCQKVNTRFASGKCALTLHWGYQFKYNSMLNSSVQYPIAQSAPVPGTTEILNRATGLLTLCTPKLCPLATPNPNVLDRNGMPMLVNFAPYIAIEAVSVGISSLSSYQTQQNMLMVLSVLGNSYISWQLLVNPYTELGPYRTEHFTSTNVWVQAGYQLAAVTQYLANIQALLTSTNAVTEVRTVNGPFYRYLLDAAATSVATHSSSILDAISTLESSLLAVFNSSSPQWPATVRLYRGYWWKYDLLPVLLCVLALVVVYVLWRRWRSTLVKEGLISHPGVGPLSTLVVTDIEDSTHFWEVLESATMDSVFTLHHSCVRTTCAKWGGYESQTEGDSFIIAFQDPMSAVSFALDLQEALMDQPWPEALLALEGCKPIWMVPLSSAEQHSNQSSATNELRLQQHHISESIPVPSSSRYYKSNAGKRAPFLVVPSSLMRESSISTLPPPAPLPPRTASERLFAALKASQRPFRMSSRRSLDNENRLILAASLQDQKRSDSKQSLNPREHSFRRHLRSLAPATCMTYGDWLAMRWQVVPDVWSLQPSSYSALTAPLPAAHPPTCLYWAEDPHSSAQVAAMQLGTATAGRNLRRRSALTPGSFISDHNQMPQFLQRWPGPVAHAPARPPSFSAGQLDLQVQDRPSSVGRLPAGPTITEDTATMPAGAILAWKGLRVRVGMHTGIHLPSDLVYSEVAARMKYSGQILEAGKAVSDAALGGMVLLSAAVVKGLPREYTHKQALLWNLGRHVLRGERMLTAQLFKPQPLRTCEQLSLGVLEAPLTMAAHVKLLVVGRAGLGNSVLGREALAVFRSIVAVELLSARGYQESCEMVLVPGQDTIMLRGLRLRAIVTHGPVKAALQPTGKLTYTGHLLQEAGKLLHMSLTGAVLASKSAAAGAQANSRGVPGPNGTTRPVNSTTAPQQQQQQQQQQIADVPSPAGQRGGMRLSAALVPDISDPSDVQLSLRSILPASETRTPADSPMRSAALLPPSSMLPPGADPASATRQDTGSDPQASAPAAHRLKDTVFWPAGSDRPLDQRLRARSATTLSSKNLVSTAGPAGEPAHPRAIPDARRWTNTPGGSGLMSSDMETGLGGVQSDHSIDTPGPSVTVAAMRHQPQASDGSQVEADGSCLPPRSCVFRRSSLPNQVLSLVQGVASPGSSPQSLGLATLPRGGTPERQDSKSLHSVICFNTPPSVSCMPRTHPSAFHSMSQLSSTDDFVQGADDRLLSALPGTKPFAGKSPGERRRPHHRALSQQAPQTSKASVHSALASPFLSRSSQYGSSPSADPRAHLHRDGSNGSSSSSSGSSSEGTGTTSANQDPVNGLPSDVSGDALPQISILQERLLLRPVVLKSRSSVKTTQVYLCTLLPQAEAQSRKKSVDRSCGSEFAPQGTAANDAPHKATGSFTAARGGGWMVMGGVRRMGLSGRSWSGSRPLTGIWCWTNGRQRSCKVDRSRSWAFRPFSGEWKEVLGCLMNQIGIWRDEVT
ncbi:MAG: hypothetical protein WDW38_003291 [Sanguina aurantia]